MSGYTDEEKKSGNKRGTTGPDRFGMPPMDLTERARPSVVASFCILFRARIEHGTLTALVVMLYNARRLSLVPPRLLAIIGWQRKGHTHSRSASVGIFRDKIWQAKSPEKQGARVRRHAHGNPRIFRAFGTTASRSIKNDPFPVLRYMILSISCLSEKCGICVRVTCKSYRVQQFAGIFAWMFMRRSIGEYRELIIIFGGIRGDPAPVA